MKKIAVFGAEGFIGSKMTSFLRDQGHSVTAFGNAYDLRDPRVVSKALGGG